MKKRTEEILSYFGSTYLCEKLLSQMKVNKIAHRTRLTDRNFSNVSKIVCSQKIHPNIEEIAEKQTVPGFNREIQNIFFCKRPYLKFYETHELNELYK